ncbi:MAG TPA: DUF3108 domain-containing protein [Rubrivivax sp.]|nr:DUF3108 domain-containing protein [Rubrivivax sp.]
MNSAPLRRRAGIVLLTLLVALGHWAVMQRLGELRIADGSAERMPRRIEVAYVRELAPAPPPAAPPVVAVRRKPAARKAAAPPPPPAEAASAVADAASAPTELAAAVRVPEAAETPASAASAASETSEASEASEAFAMAEAEAEAVAASAAVAAASAPSSAASAPAAFEWPPSTRLSYRLRGNYRGEVLGGAQVEWVRAGTHYQVHLDVWVGAQAAPLVGRRMTSDGELSEHGLSPRRYDEETRALFRELRRRTIVFEGGYVLLSNGKRPEAQPGMQDAASQFVQMTWLFTTQPQLLRVGQRIELPLALPTKFDLWSYEVVEQVDLDTPFGKVPAFHVRPRRELGSNRGLVADAWFAPTLQYLPVRLLIRQDEATYVDMMLDSLPLQEAAAGAAAASAAADASAAPR